MDAAILLQNAGDLPDLNKWEIIRDYRNRQLTACDWTQLADVSLTLEEKQNWAAYRQALRDITENYTSPDEVIFPTAPGAL